MNVTIYAEGGGDSDGLRTRFRKAFSAFMDKAVPSVPKPKLVPCGSRNEAFRKFQTAMSDPGPTRAILLVDSEDLVTDPDNPWQHLAERDRWDRPPGADSNHVFLMTVCMETWLVADAGTLEKFFGHRFRRNALPVRPPEEVTKATMYDCLERATKASSKGAYDKAEHSFEILARVDPNIVRERCPQADRLLRTLLDLLG